MKSGCLQDREKCCQTTRHSSVAIPLGHAHQATLNQQQLIPVYILTQVTQTLLSNNAKAHITRYRSDNENNIISIKVSTVRANHRSMSVIPLFPSFNKHPRVKIWVEKQQSVIETYSEKSMQTRACR